MKSIVSIRPLGLQDVAEFRRLRLVALKQDPKAFGSSLEDEAAAPDDFFAARLHRDFGSVVFGAFAGEVLVGTAGMYVLDRRASRHRGTLWGVFVAGEARGGGVGEKLVRAVIEHAAATVLVLDAKVVSTNETARRLYARLGFGTYGLERKSLFIENVFLDQELLALDFSGLPQAQTAAPPN